MGDSSFVFIETFFLRSGECPLISENGQPKKDEREQLKRRANERRKRLFDHALLKKEKRFFSYSPFSSRKERRKKGGAKKRPNCFLTEGETWNWFNSLSTFRMVPNNPLQCFRTHERTEFSATKKQAEEERILAFYYSEKKTPADGGVKMSPFWTAVFK